MKVNETCAIVALIVAGAACSSGSEIQAAADTGPVVRRTDIVSDQSGAMVTDDTLVNAWGLAFNPIGAAWVSSAEKGLSEVYDASGEAVIPPVVIPAPGSGTSAPTGQVFNDDADSFSGDTFIFVTEDGTVAGWQDSAGDTAVQRVDNSGDDAVYKGVAIAEAGDGLRLYAADFHGAKIDVFDAAYEPLETSGGFTDPDLPSGYAPFNIEEINGALLVAYALQDDDKKDDVSGSGNGYIDAFDVDGGFLGRLISQGELDSPWGMVLAPDGFDAAPGRLLVGNFGDGLVHVYTLELLDSGVGSVTLEGALVDEDGNDLAIDGLWALEFGIDAGDFNPNTLYFTAGPSDEEHGVFGSLESVDSSGGGGGGSTGGGY